MDVSASMKTVAVVIQVSGISVDEEQSADQWKIIPVGFCYQRTTPAQVQRPDCSVLGNRNLPSSDRSGVLRKVFPCLSRSRWRQTNSLGCFILSPANTSQPATCLLPAICLRCRNLLRRGNTPRASHQAPNSEFVWKTPPQTR